MTIDVVVTTRNAVSADDIARASFPPQRIATWQRKVHKEKSR